MQVRFTSEHFNVIDKSKALNFYKMGLDQWKLPICFKINKFKKKMGLELAYSLIPMKTLYTLAFLAKENMCNFIMHIN